MRLLIIGGSDAGVEAGLTALQCDPGVEVMLLVADRYPNYSVCGIPYHISGEVPDWRELAHRRLEELTAAGLDVRPEHRAVRLDLPGRQVVCVDGTGGSHQLGYDRLVLATGAVPARPPIQGLERLGPDDGVHVLHTIGDMRTLTSSLQQRHAQSVVIIGAGYIGMEMAEALRTRGLGVAVLERLPQVLPATLDAPLAAQLEETLGRHDVHLHTGTPMAAITRESGQLAVHGPDGTGWRADVVLVVTRVRPDSSLAAQAGLRLGAHSAIAVDRHSAPAPQASSRPVTACTPTIGCSAPTPTCRLAPDRGCES
jgi:NADPH-dependent 2,4-dienoyl-CoA reductase/sulfur reductase-like enzyme